MADHLIIAKLKVEPTVSLADVQGVIDAAMRDAADDPDYDLSGATPATPALQARQDEGQIGAETAILIAVVGGVSQEVLKTIWKEVIWPALRSRFGIDVAKQED